MPSSTSLRTSSSRSSRLRSRLPAVAPSGVTSRSRRVSTSLAEPRKRSTRSRPHSSLVRRATDSTTSTCSAIRSGSFWVEDPSIMTSTNGLSPVHSPVARFFTCEQAAVAATSATTVIVSRNRGVQRVTNTFAFEPPDVRAVDEKIALLVYPILGRSDPAQGHEAGDDPVDGGVRSPEPQPPQSTATSSAAQISPIRGPLSAPSRSTSTATETLSTESRLTALRRGTGSSPGSSTTSLGRPRIVVVQGATSARRNRGIAASRESTTTGRRPISGSSDHQTSPRRGSEVTTTQPRRGTTPDRPNRRARRSGARRMPPRTPRRPRRPDGGPRAPAAPRRAESSRSPLGAGLGPGPGAHHQRSCSLESGPCHNYASFMPRLPAHAFADRNGGQGRTRRAGCRAWVTERGCVAPPWAT